MDWSDVCRIGLNGLIISIFIWISMSQVGIFVITNHRICAPNFSNLKIIFMLSIFESFAASKVFTFTFRFPMQYWSAAGNIRIPADGFKYVPVDLTGTGNMCACAYDVSQWVHSNLVIRVPPEINTHFVTTFPTTKGEVPITMYPSINQIACLVIMYDEIVDQPHTTYHEIFRPYSYRQQREMFHPSAVSVCWLICFQDRYLLSVIYYKRSRQWWRW